MDRQFFKPPPNATSFDDFTPLPPVPLEPPQQHNTDGMPFADIVYISRTIPPPPSSKPTKFARPMNLPPYIGGVQSAPKGATPPPTGGILDKLSSPMGNMTLPLLIGGGVLLIVLIIR